MNTIEHHFLTTKFGRVSYWQRANLSNQPVASLNLPLAVEPASTLGGIVELEIFVFLHGVGGSGRYWFDYLQKLPLEVQSGSPKPFRMLLAVAPDLLGFGDSAKPELDYTPQTQLNVIKEVLGNSLLQIKLKLNPGSSIKIYLVGHSMGGILAVMLASQLVTGEFQLNGAAADLAGLVLLATPYPRPGHDLYKEVLRTPLNRAMLNGGLVCKIVHHTLTFVWPLALFLMHQKVIQPGLPVVILEDYLKHTCQSYTSNANWIIFKNNLEPYLTALEEIKVGEVLLVYSRDDREVLVSHGKELAGRLKGSKFHLLTKTNHVGVGQASLEQFLALLH